MTQPIQTRLLAQRLVARTGLQRAPRVEPVAPRHAELLDAWRAGTLSLTSLLFLNELLRHLNTLPETRGRMSDQSMMSLVSDEMAETLAHGDIGSLQARVESEFENEPVLPVAEPQTDTASSGKIGPLYYPQSSGGVARAGQTHAQVIERLEHLFQLFQASMARKELLADQASTGILRAIRHQRDLFLQGLRRRITAAVHFHLTLRSDGMQGKRSDFSVLRTNDMSQPAVPVGRASYNEGHTPVARGKRLASTAAAGHQPPGGSAGFFARLGDEAALLAAAVA